MPDAHRDDFGSRGSHPAMDPGGDGPLDFVPPDSGTANGLPIFSWDQAAVQLNRGGWSWSPTLGTPVTVTYAFRSSIPPEQYAEVPPGVTGFQTFNPTQILATERMLALWADVANITFVRVGSGSSGPGAFSNDATILFGNFTNGPANFSAFAFLPSPEGTGSDALEGDVWVNISRNYDADPITFPLGGHILAHEIGHTLGLHHPGDYNDGGGGADTYEDDAEYWQDTLMFSNMSYFGEQFTGANFGTLSYTPMMHDIAAAQRLYGANMTTRTGDTIYGFNSNTGRPAYFIATANQVTVFCIWDAGGADTLDLSGYNTNSQIDLREESFSSAGPGAATYNISIARGAVIENAVGGAGNDTIIGNDVANVLTGNGGADTLSGGAGADTLDGGTGADAMSGGANDDIYVVDHVADTALENASEGADLIQSSVDFTLGANVENLTLTGSAISATGNALNNVLTGNAANNVLNGGDGADTLNGETGGDAMTGGAGDDLYIVDSFGDVVTEGGSEGADAVRASVSIALSANVEILTLLGAANLNALGNAQNNVINGNAGANVLDGGAGADTLIGGLGDDYYVADNAGDAISEASAAGGVDVVQASVSFSFVGMGYIENLLLTGAADINGTGNFQFNRIWGNSGANTLSGDSGDDILDGGTGADTMLGGTGNDYFYVDNAGDVVTEFGGEGTDTLQANISFTLSDNVENLVLGTNGNLNGTGNALNNRINANIGNNTIDGGAGADQMFGGLGNDAYVVDNAGDTVSEGSAGGGVDLVLASVTYTLVGTGYAENLTLTGSADLNATGNFLNNALTGNDGANALSGGTGSDTLNGGLGADTLTGGAHNDAFVFASALGGGNVDAITDFAVVDDVMHLSTGVFGIAAGTLAASAFVIGAAAADADDRIVYDSATGALYYDADGDGAGAAVQFATLATGLALTNADFFGINP